MSYSGDIKELGNWIKRETKITEVTYNKLPSNGSRGMSARLIYLGDEALEIKEDFRLINLVLRISGDAESWGEIMDALQLIQNNLLRERKHDVLFGEAENPDGSTVEGGDFTIDLPVSITTSTGKVAL